MRKLNCKNCSTKVSVPTDRYIVEVDSCPVCGSEKMEIQTHT